MDRVPANRCPVDPDYRLPQIHARDASLGLSLFLI